MFARKNALFVIQEEYQAITHFDQARIEGAKEEVAIALAVAVTGLSIFLFLQDSKSTPARGPYSSDVLKRALEGGQDEG